MTVGAFLIVGGILLLNAAIRDENVVTIIGDVLSNRSLTPIKGNPATAPVAADATATVSPAAFHLGPGQAGPVLP